MDLVIVIILNNLVLLLMYNYSNYDKFLLAGDFNVEESDNYLRISFFMQKKNCKG